jgi:hypothetical protein
MEAVTKCEGRNCSRKESCLRFTIPPTKGWQLWDNYYTHTAKECGWFIVDPNASNNQQPTGQE